MLKRIIITPAVIFFFFIPLLGFPLLQENWPTYMGNQYLTGNNDGIIPEGDDVLWKFRSEGRLYNPVGVNGRVYVVSTDNYLYCLDMRDGSVLWKFKADSALTRMVVVYEGRVYLPSGRFIYCLDEDSGEVLWGRRDPSMGFYGTPTIAQGKIFYGNRKGFFSRELRNGHLVWENDTIYTYRGFPSYWHGLVYTVSKEFQKEHARLVALNEEDGTVRWSTELENVSNIYSPVVYRERIYIAYGKQLAVFEAETGKKLFEKAFLSDVASHPVFSQGSIYLSLAEGTIIKMDPETGNWAPLYLVPFATQFAVVGSYLFIPVKDTVGGIAVVDSVSGREQRRIGRGEGAPSDITVSRGIAFVPVKNTLVAVGMGQFLGTVSAGPVEEAVPAEEVIPVEEVGRVEAREPPELGIPFEALEEAGESGIVRGEVREDTTGLPLSGRVEATTRLASGRVEVRGKDFTGGVFEIEIPKEGLTDLIISSKGFTFETITFPDAQAIDDLSLQPLEITLTRASEGAKIRIDSIYFAVGSANLEPNSIPALSSILEMMKENPQIRIEIAGHTDSTGHTDFNLELSGMRADSVASWLIQNGVSSKRIDTTGYGDTRPIADNSTEEGRRKNRRTEIIILEEKE